MALSQAVRLPCSTTRQLQACQNVGSAVRPQVCPFSRRCRVLTQAWADEVADFKLQEQRSKAAAPAPGPSQEAPTAAASQPSERWMPAHSISTQSTEQRLLGLLGLGALLAVPAGFGAQLLDSANSQPFFVAQALGVLAAIVAVHEAGHFAAARLQGIHVTKFAIGFGPSIIAFKRGEVEYSLRAIPLGGFVAFPDDDPNSTYAADDPNLLKNRSIPERGLVISAGVIANIIFAYTSLLVQVATVGKAETAYLPGVTMPSIDASSVAARAGLQSGDIIKKVDGYEVLAAPDQVAKVVSIIREHPGQPLAFTVQRQGAPDPVTINVVPETSAYGTGRIGVTLKSNSFINHLKGSNPAESLEIANKEFWRLLTTVLGGVKQIITNFAGVASQVSGPVAIVAAGADIAKTDGAGLFQFCAIVNINLAIVNMLPLPALDGGYLLLLAIEALRGKKLPEKLEQGFMASGFLLLVAMGFSLIVKDTLNLLPPAGL